MQPASSASLQRTAPDVFEKCRYMIFCRRQMGSIPGRLEVHPGRGRGRGMLHSLLAARRDAAGGAARPALYFVRSRFVLKFGRRSELTYLKMILKHPDEASGSR